jgi:riboflavin synthase
MFTGIITAIGTVQSTEQRGDLRVVIGCPYDPAYIGIGASIACSGACMTVVDRGGGLGAAWFAVSVSAESLARTCPGMWAAGSRINLEQALRLGDELGGHIVTGHVDAVATVADIRPEGDSLRFTVSAPADLAPFIAAKGSITVNGVSLTVNEVADQADGTVHFGLNIIPHTAGATTLGDLRPGASVNLEIDTIARYLQRMEQLRG